MGFGELLGGCFGWRFWLVGCVFSFVIDFVIMFFFCVVLVFLIDRRVDSISLCYSLLFYVVIFSSLFKVEIFFCVFFWSDFGLSYISFRFLIYVGVFLGVVDGNRF